MKYQGKLLSAIVALLILVCISLLLYFFIFKKDSDSQPKQTAVAVTGQERVFVTGFDKSIDSETKKSIERFLYSSIDKDQPDLYTGTVRAESYSATTMPNKQVMTVFLIDVNPMKITYKVTLFGNGQGRPSMNIDCASQSEQIISSTVCRDVHSHE